MKKLISLVLILSLTLCGCSAPRSSSALQPNSASQSYFAVESGSAMPSSFVETNSFVSQPSSYLQVYSTTGTQYEYNPDMDIDSNYDGNFKLIGLTEFKQKYEIKEYLKYTESDNPTYNKALEAFNLYLTVKTDGLTKENYTYLLDDHVPVIRKYALFDFDMDGIPEMITDSSLSISSLVKVHKYVDGKLSSWQVPWAILHGPMEMLSNGLIYIQHSSLGMLSEVYKMDDTGGFSLIGSHYCTGKLLENGEMEIIFNLYGKDVNREEWEEYMKKSGGKADIQWIDYYEEYIVK